MLTHIASCCHIVFVSSLCSSSLCNHFKDKMAHSPPPGTVFDVNFRWKSEGGGGDKRVSQASASSVVRLDKLPSCIVETQWNGIVQNIAFIIVSRVLTMPSPSLTKLSKGCLA